MYNKSALIVGCGGLGGFVIEELARLGLSKLILFDGDVFNESNLNRQLLSNKKTIGKHKAEAYAEWIKQTSNCEVSYYNKMFSTEDFSILESVDFVIDCVDNINTRLMLEEQCTKYNKILVHGAIDGDQGQCLIDFPNSFVLKKLYKKSDEVKHITNSYSVALVSTIQVSLANKILLGEEEEFRNKLVIIDSNIPMVKVVDL